MLRYRTRSALFMLQTLLVLVLASGCGKDGGRSAMPSGSATPCQTLSSCCASNPLGAGDECRTLVSNNDATECTYFLEDARAEGQCGGTTSTDAGTTTGRDAGECLMDGWQGCGATPCCNTPCTEAPDEPGIYVCQAAATTPDAGPPACAGPGEPCAGTACCAGSSCRPTGLCG